MPVLSLPLNENACFFAEMRVVERKKSVYRVDSNLAKVQLNINSKALVAHIDRAYEYEDNQVMTYQI